jgi:hypothetical protein
MVVISRVCLCLRKSVLEHDRCGKLLAAWHTLMCLLQDRTLPSAGTMNTFYFVRSVLDCVDDPAGCVLTDRVTTIVSILSLLTSAVMLGNKAGPRVPCAHTYAQ